MTKCPASLLRYLMALATILVLARQARPAQDFWVPADPPNAHYKIEGRMEISDKEVIISGVGTIAFKSTFSKLLSVVALDWSLDSRSSVEISARGKPLRLLNAGKGLARTSPLFYELPTPIAQGVVLEMDLKFSRRFDELNLADPLTFQKWHPALWWEGIPTRDSYKVTLSYPPGYAMAISGRLNKQTGYYENDGVTTSFGIYLARDMKTEERDVEGVLITSLFTKGGEECARLCLDTATDIIKFYKSWLGFYPFKCLSIVPGASRPMGGYPFASAIVVIHGQEKFKEMPLLHWKWITAHEIGHQYWGECVMSGDYPYDYTSSWLQIGMGICTDKRWTLARNLGPEKHLGFLNRYLDGVRKRYDTTVDAPESLRKRQEYDLNNVVIHGKGFSILSALESVVGKDVFDRVLRQSLKEYQGKRLGWQAFAKVCERESGENLTWFFEQWVRTNKYLCAQITSKESAKENGKLTTRIRVEAAPGCIQMPIPVKAVFEDGSSQVKRTERLAKVNVLRFESPSKLKEAVLDPERALAMLPEPLAVLPNEIPEKIQELPWTGSGRDALEIFKLPETKKINSLDLWFKLGMTLFDGAYFRESREAFTKITELNPPQLLHFAALV